MILFTDKKNIIKNAQVTAIIAENFQLHQTHGVAHTES